MKDSEGKLNEEDIDKIGSKRNISLKNNKKSMSFPNLSGFSSQASIHRDSLMPKQEEKIKKFLECKDRKNYYIEQRKNAYFDKMEREIVKINVSQDVSKQWKQALDKAITSINDAAPGLHLYITEENESNIKITTNPHTQIQKIYPNLKVYTLGSYKYNKKATIHLKNSWHEKKGTMLHELMHALAFQHQHQRNDCRLYFEHDSNSKNQYQAINEIFGITAFDPFSIMKYPQSDNLKRKEGSSVWWIKESNEHNIQLSQLDKVALNIIFPPVRIQKVYEPEKNHSNKMWYCGRKVMQRHNHPAMSTASNGTCGPTGPNCPSCRTLINEELDVILGTDRWQGWSGHIYCGKKFQTESQHHDGFCGPDNGTACPDCTELMTSIDKQC